MSLTVESRRMTELSAFWRRAAAVQERNGNLVMALMLRNEAYKLEQEALKEEAGATP